MNKIMIPNKGKRYAGLILLLVIMNTVHLIGQQAEIENEFHEGIWQTIVDGKSGEGAIFHRLTFKDDGTLQVLKQYGGKDNLIETKSWYQEGSKIIITSETGDQLTDFDGPSLRVLDENTLDYANNGYVGIVKPYFQGQAILHWILILVVLIFLNELFRRSKWSTIIFFVLLPLALTPLVWSQQGVTYWFKWVKIYSVIFAVIWFTLIRFSNLGKHNIVKLIAALFLAVNIAEAVSQDFSMGYLPNILNGIAGIFSIITLFYGWKQIGPDKSKEKDMIWPGMAILWIVAYDVWNIVYVYLNFPGSTSAQFMVILACTIPALFIKKGTWLQARAFTLAAWFMYYFTFPRFTEQMELLVPRNYTLMLLAAIVSIILNTIYFIVFIQKIRARRQLTAIVIDSQDS